MKAAIRVGFTGLTYAFSDKVELPSSVLKSDEVLIKVHAAAINPVDYKVPKAMMGLIYGIDMCGTIQEIGSNDVDVGANNEQNNKFQVGDVVFGPCQSGSLAEYTIANISKIAKVPNNYKVLEAAALPTAYNTAMTAFVKVGIAKVNDDGEEDETLEITNLPESMLVIGASGGCGIAAIQLAKGMGVKRIIGICSSKNAEFILQNGATEVVPYDDSSIYNQFLMDNVGNIEFIYDTASYSGGGEDYMNSSLTLLTPEKTGSYATLNGPISVWLGQFIWGKPFFSNPRQQRQQHLIITTHRTLYLQSITKLLDQAQLKPILNIMEFTEQGCKTALFDKLKSRRCLGKIVFEISSSSTSTSSSPSQ